MNASSTQASRLFSAYLSTKKVLIADPNNASRSGLGKLIVGMGAKSNHLIMVNEFIEAKNEIKTRQPEIIISEYNLPNGNGLDLSQETRFYENQKEKIFVLVTSNSAQSLVAQAAEEDIDVFILKPYTIKSFSENLMRTALAKIYPSDYLKTIEEGKKLLSDSKHNEAIETFNHAATLNPSPTLALYYRGQAELFKKLVNNAESSYSVGLSFNDIHYKCLTGLFDLLMDQKRPIDAYAVVKKIAHVFPANPSRLAQVLSLAVQTGNLSDVESYYELFLNVDARSDQMVRYVSAAMVVCGKHFIRQGQKDKGVDILKKAAISCAGRAAILREIVSALLEAQNPKEAKLILDRFPPASQTEIHYFVSKFLVENHESNEHQRLVMNLTKLIRDGNEDPILYYWLILHLKALGKIEDAENYLFEASRKWPQEERLFKSAFSTP